jgi:2-polyprenyl-3-methyl-5-hydroxy-6-metoxy-1,4-benzoquinol methylase
MNTDQSDWIVFDSCPACGSSDRELWTRDKNRREGLRIECDAWICLKCSSIYLNPVPDAEKVNQDYSETHSSPPHVGLLGRNANRIVDSWARLWAPSLNLRGEPREMGEGESLLSIGCGYATSLQKYHSRGWKVHGVDSDSRAIEWNRRNVEGQFFHGTFEGYTFDQQFDVIHCSAVLEHAYDPLAFLIKARNLLRPGGRLCFYTPNAGGAMTRLLKSHSIAFWVPFHLILFTPTGLRLLAERAGLDSTVTTISEPHLASLSIRQWRSRNKPSFTLQKDWDTRITTLIAAPIWSILNRFELGEDLALFAELPS